ncbi:leucine-rich repeat-containing serine/threonine-protein kinase [Pseudomonas stutzeri]|uniref:Protein kinase n=1 Tax=Stutzerimonas stutzeri TaxID=316 RepID=A0A2N8S0K5_STUST|nr:leucine-rich repeat-containing protein kinase family protein [Stutzerimonas stutzeri]MCQ4297359.1 leucine-rich repeat-containing serine/threonine-protein kinase [Stutzerimonas stutzeri]PNF80157.1 protein kinase [Stutzerimonas stutzeri]
MHTLEQLERGELAGTRRLDLSADLQTFPEAIFSLADTLEVLNLSDNRLDALPADLSRLRKLRILFCSDNLFTEMPACLGDCAQLEMIGFKANQIRHLPAAALPPALRWLILTDNQLQALPEEIGKCRRLQKLMLAGNQLAALPDALANCTNLELLRIAANHLQALPDWLLTLPRLSWLAAAGNPFSDTNETMSLARHSLPAIPREQVILHEQLGQGASGIIHRAEWHPAGRLPRQMAAKLFKGHVTSDGLPHSETAACVAAGAHPNLIDVAGPLAEHAGQTPGLLMDLVEPIFQPLAGAPSLASCTRDCYADDKTFTLEQVLRIARGTVSAVAHLHERGILHGDLYAHNLLVEPNGECLLSDFGAASFFEPDSAIGEALRRVESRAFGCLLEELLQRCPGFDNDPRRHTLSELQNQCMSEQPARRPDFSQLHITLAAL